MNMRAIYEFDRLDRVVLASFVRGVWEIPCWPSVALNLTDILPCPRHLTCSSQSAVDFNSLNFYTFTKNAYGSVQNEITVDTVCKWWTVCRSHSLHTLLTSSACRPQLTLEMLVIGFFHRSDTAVFVIWICCIVNITELLLKMDWSIGEDVTAITDCVPENVYGLGGGGGVWIELFVPRVVELCVSWWCLQVFTEHNDLNVVVLCEYMCMYIHTCMYIYV